MSLPTADDLFRPTSVPEPETNESEEPARPEPLRPSEAASRAVERRRRGQASSGRVRHDEKMTVYVTSDELLELEHARLMLRRAHGVAVDRGRLVREAVAIVLADLDVNGDDSVIVQRLMQV